VKASLVKKFEWFKDIPGKLKEFDLQPVLKEMNWDIEKGIWVLEHDFILLKNEWKSLAG